MTTCHKLHELHNQIHLGHEILSTEGSTPREFEVLYLGLSRAFYISADGQAAGYGEWIQKKWIWTEDPSLSPLIRKTLQIQKNLSTAEYVSLPLTLKE